MSAVAGNKEVSAAKSGDAFPPANPHIMPDLAPAGHEGEGVEGVETATDTDLEHEGDAEVMDRNGSRRSQRRQRPLPGIVEHYLVGALRHNMRVKLQEQEELERRKAVQQLQAEECQEGHVGTVRPGKIRVRCLKLDVDSVEVADFFRTIVGGVVKAEIVKWRDDTGKSRSSGKAFVTFQDEEYVKKLESLRVDRRAALGETSMSAKHLSSRDDGYILVCEVLPRRQNAIIRRDVDGSTLTVPGKQLHIGNKVAPDALSVWWSSVGDVQAELDIVTPGIAFKLDHEGTRYKIALRFTDVRGYAGYFSVMRNGAAPQPEGPGRTTVRWALTMAVAQAPHVFREHDAGSATRDGFVYNWTAGSGPQDDEGEWLRTTDFTGCSALASCSTFRLDLGDLRKDQLKLLAQVLLRFGLLHFTISKQPLDLAVVDRRELERASCRLDELPPDRLWQVRCLLSKGCLHLEKVSADFVDALKAAPGEAAAAALEDMYVSGQPLYDPLARLRTSLAAIAAGASAGLLTAAGGVGHELPPYTAAVRRVLVTPLRLLCLPAEPEMSNRVLRRFRDHRHRFVRLSFAEEDGSKIYVKENTGEEIKERMQRYLDQGVRLGAQYFKFLAFSSSQCRDSSCWMFEPAINFGPEEVRNFMGVFSNIRNPGKYAARMGQCYSSTVQTLDMEEYSSVKDVERQATTASANTVTYCFSDGVGRISFQLALEMAERIRGVGLRGEVEVPSAFQIRYRGCKGMVAWWPELGKGKKMQVRPSMEKFPCQHPAVEVLQWSRFLPATLNRQVVLLLSTLGVPVDKFLQMQDTMIDELDRMLVEPAVARRLLPMLGNSDEPIMRCLSSATRAGLCATDDPFLAACLRALRCHSLRELRSGAHILAPQGALLFGIMDEAGVLEYGQVYVCIQRTPESEEETLHCPLVLTKSPCLHPGDILVLQGVDPPQLRHLKNVVVFPQKGPRPHCNETSGGDLDGDQYFLFWDPELIPPRTHLAFEYPAPPEERLDRPLGMPDITAFFMRYMENETLGQIANAHLVHADGKGCASPECLKLAELHHYAVDFPKTGQPAMLPRELRPEMYPHFMEKPDRPAYQSNGVLGKLYDRVALPESLPAAPDQADLDPDLVLDRWTGWDAAVEAALPLRMKYEMELLRLMHRYQVFNEGEMLTGCLLSRNSQLARKRKPDQIKHEITIEVRGMWERYRNIFIAVEGGGGTGAVGSILPAQLERQLLLRASAWYYATYCPAFHQDGEQDSRGAAGDGGDKTGADKAGDGDQGGGVLGMGGGSEKLGGSNEKMERGREEEPGGRSLPGRLFSFPWIVHQYLVRLKAARASANY